MHTSFTMKDGAECGTSHSTVVGVAGAAICLLAASAMSGSMVILQAPFTSTLRSAVTDGTRNNAAYTLLGNYASSDEDVLSVAAAHALGDRGVSRLEAFRRLSEGWDGRGASPLNVQSLKVLNRFFDDTRLNVRGLSVFMSTSGILAVNWEDVDGGLVELEFLPDRIAYFVESTNVEGVVERGDLGASKLLSILPEVESA